MSCLRATWLEGSVFFRRKQSSSDTLQQRIRESLLLQLALLLAPRNGRRRLKPVVYVVERDRQPCQNDASFASLAEDVWHDVPAADIKRHKWCFQQLTEIHLLLPHLLHRLLELILHTRVRDGRDSSKSHKEIHNKRYNII